MEVINNISKKLGDDLKGVIQSGSHLSIAAACFSIYAFDELRKELEGIKELRFIFTSPSFTTEKASKERKSSSLASTESGASLAQNLKSSLEMNSHRKRLPGNVPTG